MSENGIFINVYANTGWVNITRGQRQKIHTTLTEASHKRLTRLVRTTGWAWAVWPYHDGWTAVSKGPADAPPF